MKSKLSIAKIIGYGAMILGAVAGIASGWAEDKVMSEEIDKRVNEALANRSEEERA